MKIKHSNKKLNIINKEKENNSSSYQNLDERNSLQQNHEDDDSIKNFIQDDISIATSKNKKISSEKINKTNNYTDNENFINKNNKNIKKPPRLNEKRNYENGKEPNKKAFKVSESLLITDLDEFFKNIYDYYYNKGFNNILTHTILDNISYIFSIHFLVVNIFLIDWKEIILKCKYQNYCSSEISEYFTKNQIIENLMKNKLYFSIFYTSLVIYYFIFLIKSVIHLKNMKFIKKIYDQKLKIKQSELENIKFDLILTKLISLQKTEGFCRIKENITKFDIVSRMMRQENYLIALFSNGIIDTKINFSLNIKIPFWDKEIFKRKFVIDLFSNFFYSKLNEAVISFAFGAKDKSLNKEFINLKSLRLKLFIFMIFEIVFLIPFVFLKMIFWLFKNADSIKSDKKTIFLKRNWDKKVQLLFKNYNELQHYFDYRMIKYSFYLSLKVDF